MEGWLFESREFVLICLENTKNSPPIRTIRKIIIDQRTREVVELAPLNKSDLEKENSINSFNQNHLTKKFQREGFNFNGIYDFPTIAYIDNQRILL